MERFRACMLLHAAGNYYYYYYYAYSIIKNKSNKVMQWGI